MTETLVNGFLKVRRVEHETFVETGDEKYKRMGIVELRDEKNEFSKEIPTGAKIYFDPLMARADEEDTNVWYVPYSEIHRWTATT